MDRDGERYLGHEMLAVGPGTKTGMAIRYDNPREIGADRLVNAVAIRERFGGAGRVRGLRHRHHLRRRLRDGEYIGGSLMTGIEISLEALSERGARLPKVDLAPPTSVIGKNTIDAIRSGVVFGYAGAIDAILRRLYDELGERADGDRHGRPGRPRGPVHRGDRGASTTCSRSPACGCCTSATPDAGA